MDSEHIGSLLSLARAPSALGGAKQIAGSVVNHDPQNMHNACAATLSCLLNFSGIYVGVRQEVIDLAAYLQHQRAWSRLEVGGRIADGDVGVFIGTGLHHIYTVVDAADQAHPLIADNQGAGMHKRPVAGGPMPGIGNDADATSYFLRAT